MKKNTFEIDNITWNDLSLEDIFSRLNCCITSAGEDYLYNRLRNPYIERCGEFDAQTRLFDEAEKIKKNSKLIDALNKTAKLKNYKYLEEIEKFKSEEIKSNTKHYVIGLLVIISFCMFFVVPGPALIAFFIMVAYAVSDYFRTKNIIAGKLSVFNYIIRMIKAFSKVKDSDYEELSEYNCLIARLDEIRAEFKPFMRGTFIISESAKTNSNPFSLLFDYVRMIFHVDIIKYNAMIGFLNKHIDEAIEFYYIVGKIDCALCISSINERKDVYIKDLCKPNFVDEYKNLYLEDAYHPSVKDSVSNSINTKRNVLITGCNASGKSTFLKTVAINAIFAQGLGLCFAKKYEAPFMRIYSSMALKDSIDSGESYFMAEIKSLKRIVDDSANPVLCVVDEVLRGTNTVERIAASVEILKSLNKEKVLCFAATHDIELTDLLSEDYDNYHFSEDVLEDDVRFSYLIKEGPANSRNAIRLLSLLGYDANIVNNATNRADNFIKSGKWK